MLLLQNAGPLSGVDGFYSDATLEPDASSSVDIYCCAAGSKLRIKPYTLKCFDTAPTELIEGFLPSDNPTVTHAYISQPETQLLVG